MRSKILVIGLLLFAISARWSFMAVAHRRKTDRAEAPPTGKVVPDVDVTLFSVDHPEQFPLAEATERPTVSELVVTGTVTPDVSRSVPVVSLASGRVMAIHARLGDTVKGASFC